jgi:hypothetical protein
MSEDDLGFAPPPFKPEDALQRLTRELRAMGLTLRASEFERRGVRLVRAHIDGPALAVGVVRRPSRGSPEWQSKRLASSAELRDFIAELKRKLSAWGDAAED